jgi:hypothetical protein
MTQDPWTWTTRPPQTVQDVVCKLAVEFDGRVPPQNASEVIVRLSANGAVSLPVLTYMARQHLERLAGAGGLSDAVGGSAST